MLMCGRELTQIARAEGEGDGQNFWFFDITYVFFDSGVHNKDISPG